MKLSHNFRCNKNFLLSKRTIINLLLVNSTSVILEAMPTYIEVNIIFFISHLSQIHPQT